MKGSFTDLKHTQEKETEDILGVDEEDPLRDPFTPDPSAVDPEDSEQMPWTSELSDEEKEWIWQREREKYGG